MKTVLEAKSAVRIVATGVVALALTGAQAAVDAALTWIGPSTGGNWTNAANWRLDSGSCTVAEAMSKNCSWTFGSNLADGAVVTNTSTTLQIGELYYQPGVARTLTLYGSDTSSFVFGSACAMYCVKPGTLDFKLHVNSIWSSASDTRVVFLGGGTFNFAPRGSCYLYKRDFQPCSGTTVRFGSAVQLKNTWITMWDAKSLTAIDADANLAWISASGTNTAGLLLENGHTLTLTSGEPGKSTVEFNVPVKGVGNIKAFGGNTFSYKDAFDYTGWFNLVSGMVNFNSVVLPKTVELQPDGNGVFSFGAAQELGVIRGGGSTGGICMADDAALTVSGDDATTSSQFDARITGKSDFTKKGTNYWLTLTGDNAWTGTTRVAEGTLGIKRKTERPGLIARWTFDDPSDLGANATGTGVKLTLGAGEGSSYGAARGVNGGGALRLTSGSGSTRVYAVVAAADQTVANGFAARYAPFSYTFWFKPDLSKFSGEGYVLRRGGWNAYNNFMLWLNKKKQFRLTCDSYGKTDDALNIYATVDDVDDGNWHHVAVTYGDRHLALWYDGKLLGETSFTQNIFLQAPTYKPSFGELLALGNSYAGTDHHVSGDFDDFCAWNRELTAEDVAREFALRADAGETVAPQPIARWRFDDAADMGKDDMGKSPLVRNAASPVTTAPAPLSQAGALGTMLNTAAMTTQSGGYPVGMPTGEQPYSISVRLLARSATENRAIFTIGDYSAAQKALHFGYHACPRRFGVNYCSQKESECNVYASEVSESGLCQEHAFVHFIITCNPSTYMMRIYRDGKLINTCDKFWTNLPADGTLYLNWRPDSPASTTYSAIDDLQIFDYDLTPDDARVLARSLATGQVGPVLPKDSAVTVEQDATLAVEGSHVVSNAMAGAGRVLLERGARFGAANWIGFSGTVEGVGCLVAEKGQALPLAAAQVTSDVTFEEGAILLSADAEKTPLVRTSGTLRLPEVGRIGFAPGSESMLLEGGVFKIAECSAYEGPATTALWTIDEDNPRLLGTFVFRDGMVYLQMNLRGGAVILR